MALGLLIHSFCVVSEDQESGHYTARRLYYFMLAGEAKNESALTIVRAAAEHLMFHVLSNKHSQKFRL